MKITESKLRKMIREVILEFTATSAAGKGTKLKKGEKSAATRTAQSAEDKSSTAYDNAKTSKKNAETALSKARTALDGLSSQKFRKANPRARSGYDYSATKIAGGEYNPEWTTANNDATTKERTLDLAKSDETSKKSDYDTKKSARRSAEQKDIEDSQTTVTPTADEPKAAPTGGKSGGRGGKGKGKGKGKGTDDDVEWR